MLQTVHAEGFRTVQTKHNYTQLCSGIMSAYALTFSRLLYMVACCRRHYAAIRARENIYLALFERPRGVLAVTRNCCVPLARVFTFLQPFVIFILFGLPYRSHSCSRTSHSYNVRPSNSLAGLWPARLGATRLAPRPSLRPSTERGCGKWGDWEEPGYGGTKFSYLVREKSGKLLSNRCDRRDVRKRGGCGSVEKIIYCFPKLTRIGATRWDKVTVVAFLCGENGVIIMVCGCA